ncbi:leucine-rich repeat protein [uncultured Eubacterium sp.]|uniref:leucine-rich repeat protein n=1 Tax=uncultured Eubacterium sp. TaxID=165185 RepID=UPI0025CF8588|nr:leucine-rich repeat protein [uncultured Eubacterium sp.]
MKRAISLLMSFVMLFSVISSVNLSAYAEESATSGKCGDNVYWSYDSTTDTLTISGKGAMNEYNEYDAPWRVYRQNILTVKIETGVTTIENNPFYYCSSLTNINVASGNLNYSSKDGVLFNKNKSTLIQYPIGNQRTEYTIPNSVKTIERNAFEGCSSLTSVTIPDSVTTIGHAAFSNCSSLTSVTIPNSVTTIGNETFYLCNSLTSVTIPNSVTTIGKYAFTWCSSLTSIDVASGNLNYSSKDGVLFNKNKSTLIQYPIGNQRTEYTVPNSVTTIGVKAFFDCMSLTNVTLPNSVTTIELYAFFNCSSLTNVTIPNSVTTIGEYAFYPCIGLKDVYYSGSEEQWKKISIGEYNEPLTNATIHYNSSLPEQPDDGTSKDYIKNDFISDDKPFKGKHGYCYSDSYFDQPATQYNQSLATMSLCLAFSTYSSKDEVKNKDKNTKKMLEECGYGKYYEQYHFNEKPKRDSIGCAIASKEYNGSTIIAVAVRSGGYTTEWASNLNIGKKDDHEGFDQSAELVRSYILQYINLHKINSNVKIWIAGYSRGAAVATQTAAKLQNGVTYVENGVYVTKKFDKNSVYAYGFATPAGAIKDNKPNSSKYNNIFNIIDYNDPVPLVAPEQWNFTRYGQTRVLPFRESTDSKKYNIYIKQIKKEMGNDWKVDDFKNYLFNYILYGGNLSFLSLYAIENPFNKDSLGTYNRKLVKGLAKYIKDRNIYCSDFQSGITDAVLELMKSNDRNPNLGDVAYAAMCLTPELIVSHPNLSATLAKNFSMVADVHVNQKYYLYWMQLMDKNYSNNLPTLFTDGDFRKIIVNCPVDIKVYDSNNTLVASIINDEPQEIEDSSIVSSVDDNNQKVVYLPQDEEYRVEVTSREDCQTTYTIEELAGVDSDVSRVVTYDSLAMKQGDTITSTINRYTQDEIDNVVDNGSSVNYKTKLNNQVVSSDVDVKGSEVEKYTYNVNVTSNSEECSAVGSGTFNIGEFAQVEASPADNYTFDGWYIDSKKVSSDASYRFAVKSNVNVEAKFKSVETGGGSTDPTPTPGGGGGGGAIPAPIPDETDKKDDNKKPETKPNQSQNTSTSATQKLRVKKLVSKKKALVVYWNKIVNVSGYQIQVATDKKFKKNKKTVTVAKQNASKKTVKKLKAKKKYFVRVRAYKTVNGKKSYGKWSKIKSVKTK